MNWLKKFGRIVGRSLLLLLLLLWLGLLQIASVYVESMATLLLYRFHCEASVGQSVVVGVLLTTATTTETTTTTSVSLKLYVLCWVTKLKAPYCGSVSQ